MKGKISASVIRSFIGLCLGLLLILWPESVVKYLVITIGALFVIPGLISLISYFCQKRGDDPSARIFPIDGAGSIVLGIWLLVMPEFFVGVFMYVLGGLLIIAGTQQAIWLSRARKRSVIPFGFYLPPTLILLTGIIILFYPLETAANTFVIFGVAFFFYSIFELLNWFKFREKKSHQEDPY